MSKINLFRITAVLLSCILFAGCSPRSAMSTLSISADDETSSIFSLTKVLDLGTNYLISLDYDNAILQYIEIIEHEPSNKDAYAGLYAAYSAQGKAEEAKRVLEQAKEQFAEEDDFLPEFLDSAKLVFSHGGGSAPYRMLSDHYLDLSDESSLSLQSIGNAWLEQDPTNYEPYAVLSTYYARQSDDDQLLALLLDAEENGLDLDEIEMQVKTDSNGTCTLELQIEALTGSGKTTVDVTIAPEDDAAEIVEKIEDSTANKAVDEAIKNSGLTGEAARIATSMAQEALGIDPGKFPASSPSSSAPSTTAVPEDELDDDFEYDFEEDFDWSEIDQMFDELGF